MSRNMPKLFTISANVYSVISNAREGLCLRLFLSDENFEMMAIFFARDIFFAANNAYSRGSPEDA